MLRDCPTDTSKEREAKKDLSEGTIPIPPNYGRFYCLQARKDENPDEGAGKFSALFEL